MMRELNVDEEEIKLWKKFNETGDHEIRNILVEKYAPLVKYVAGKMFQKMPNNVEFDDLISAGIFGLFDAINKFDITMNVLFKTYAISRIQGAIRDDLRSHDPLPRSIRQKIRELDETTQLLQNKLERQPSESEIIEAMNITKEQYDKIMSYVSQAYVLSLNSVLFTNNDGEQITYFDQVGTSNEVTPEFMFAEKDLIRVLKTAIKELPERELKVLVLYYFEELTLKEIGKVLNVTESRVSQLHGRALNKLKNKLFSYRKGVFEK